MDLNDARTENPDMDDIDRKILDILQKDASTPLSKVAEMIGIPKPTAYLRFNKMKAQGVIKGFSLVVREPPQGKLKGAILQTKGYLLSGMGERIFAALGERLSREPGVVFAARLSKTSLLVFYLDGRLDLSSLDGVVGIEEIQAEIYKR